MHNIINAPLTPSPLERPQRTKLPSPHQASNLEDLYKVINKKVLHDFESKPFSQISNEYKNLSNLAGSG
jgi:hypothetical protein